MAEIDEFWATALPLIRAIDAAELKQDIPHISAACDAPMAYAMRLTPSGAAYVQVNLAARKINPALWLAIRIDSIELNPVESAAAILTASRKAEEPGFQAAHTAVLCRYQLCITANGQIDPVVDALWAAAPFIGPDWVCTKYVPPLHRAIVETSEDLHPLAHSAVWCDFAARKLYLILERDGPRPPALMGFLHHLLGEALFARIAGYVFHPILRATPGFAALQAGWAPDNQALLLVDFPALLHRHFAVKICPRCGLSSDNTLFEGEHCRYCAAFHEQVERAIVTLH